MNAFSSLFLFILLRTLTYITTGYMRIHPCTFACGTKTKPYTTATWDSSRYNPDLEPPPLDLQQLTGDEYDRECLKESDYRVFQSFMNPKVPGPVVIATRGKYTAIASGLHCAVISWGLEAHLVGMPTSVYDAITAVSHPGKNPDIKKRNKLRTFLIPPEFIEPDSKPLKKDEDTRSVTTFLAIITPTWVWTICDFSRLVRFHIISLSRVWNKEDLSPSSELWPVIWSKLKCGPDWRYEYELVRPYLDAWRLSILDKQSDRCIAHAMEDDSMTFSPFGKHLISDGLHYLGIYPGMPAFSICESDSLYEALVSGLSSYICFLFSAKTLSLIAVRMNSLNPFAFNVNADTEYTNFYMLVFRKGYSNVPVALFNRFVEQGLLDPNHTIGKLFYLSILINDPLRKFVVLPVWIRGKFYTVIRAKVPDNWTGGNALLTAEDHRQAGYVTTIGPENFHETKANNTNLKGEIKGHPGRPAKASIPHISCLFVVSIIVYD
ncbi:hypothetical protein K435DRAFT_660314 [Dendrothele bispora CBS 962.96]|uniref:Uncharacterized protein n=1 Tax=Dendrothele bispora (strain CBS 962.96) TaxID=1314807 RepID=A0A4S8M8N4_DENBC|nr:hypothetical protein K435DRAFT_660314 [Dendrothele bispora CBS 962.96]